MAELICSVKSNIYNDGTTSQTISYYDEAGAHVKSKDLGEEGTSGLKEFAARFAPEGHPLAEAEKPVVQDVKPVDGKVEEPKPVAPAVEAVPSNDPATAPTHPA